MATDRKQKKKKKRDEKKKLRRQSADRVFIADKAKDYYWYMADAYNAGDYAEALKWALKRLKLFPGDEKTHKVAIYCAQMVRDESTLYTLLRQKWQENRLTGKDEHLSLAVLAMGRKDYELGSQVLQNLIDAPEKLSGRLTKAALKDAKNYLAYCQNMLTVHASISQQKAIEAAPPGKQAEIAKSSKSQQPLKTHGSSAEENLPKLKITFELDDGPVLQAIQAQRKTDFDKFQLALNGYKLSFRTSYDQLICLPGLHNVQSLWYQEETARKVMRTFRGRAILADEVGLGKTIEAGLILKEYVMRGLVGSALVLTPSSLVHQWQEEMSDKFALEFVSSNDPLARQDPESFWKQPFVVASIHTAKTKRHFAEVTGRNYDLVIVDEAHHLKNRTTLNWKLINAIRKTFLLMLTATPVQNSLEELYNLVTLLRPGHLKTLKAFKEEYVTRGNPTDPQNREKLKQLLKEVMVRNTRSVTQLHLPPRYASTVRIMPNSEEETFYGEISRLVIEQSKRAAGSIKLRLRRLLEAAGSSHVAALRMLEKTGPGGWDGAEEQVLEAIEVGKRIGTGNKTEKVVELLRSSPEQKIIFVNYIATLEYLQQVLEKEKIQHVVFHGSLSADQRKKVIDAFQDGCQILLSTGSGGEGYNLQFCQTMVNFDLPWNPMAIEQRIGRIHRIGQEKDVHIYNFCSAGSLEDRILEVLDRKINMFELVVGEIDMILGRLKGEEEFSDMVYDIWLNHPDDAERNKAFDSLVTKLKRARSSYEKSKELDEKLFQEDFGI
ncbi:MAG: SNF2-related protein [Desulfoferrobacter sp.]